MSLRSKDYGPVVSTIEPDCHRYQTKLSHTAALTLIMGPMFVAMGWFALKTELALEIPDFMSYVVGSMGVVFLLLAVWIAYLGIFRKALLVLTPDSITFSIRGMIPFSRSGSWSWPPNKLFAVTVDVTPMPARTRPVPISGIRLEFRGERGRKTFFVFNSPREAERLQHDIMKSAAEMIERYNARIEGRAPLP
jgi:hypothetical protein